MNQEIYKRIALLLVNGYSRQSIVNKILSGDLVAKEVTEAIANKWIDEASKLLEVDIGEDAKYNYSRLLNIYKGCMDKRDYSNALKALKELQQFKDLNQDKEITIKFVK